MPDVLQTLSKAPTPLRQRAHAILAYVRDQAKREGFDIEHVPGTMIPADALAKVLPKGKLEEPRKKLKVLAVA